MTTGITVNAGCCVSWNEMKLRHKFTFLTFKVLDDREIVVDKFGAKNSPYEVFRTSLPVNDCRYAVVEVPGTTKIVFVMWAPDTAPVKQRMIYASTRQAILEKLPGHSKSTQASEIDDLDVITIQKLVS